MLKAAIFDMDGTIIDSEPHWEAAEKIVFERDYGIQLLHEQCQLLMGWSVWEVVKFWFEHFDLPTNEIDRCSQNITLEVIKKVKEDGVLLPGVLDTIQLFKEMKLPIALASGSSMNLIEAVVDALGIRACFDVLKSAEHEDYGKPHPGVFITTANTFKVDPTSCIVFEDSLPGVIAGKAARMKTVNIPAAWNWDSKQFEVADLRLRSMVEFNKNHINQLFSVQ